MCYFHSFLESGLPKPRHKRNQMSWLGIVVLGEGGWDGTITLRPRRYLMAFCWQSLPGNWICAHFENRMPFWQDSKSPSPHRTFQKPTLLKHCQQHNIAQHSTTRFSPSSWIDIGHSKEAGVSRFAYIRNLCGSFAQQIYWHALRNCWNSIRNSSIHQQIRSSLLYRRC